MFKIKKGLINSRGKVFDNIIDIHFEESIGDYIAVAKNNKCIIYDDKSIKFKSHHAGLTDREMLIPIIVKEKQKIKIKGQ